MMGEKNRRIEKLGTDDLPAIVSVLAESFVDYPVMRYVLGEDPDYPGRLDRLLRFFVLARALREEPLLGIRTAEGLQGVALVSDPSAKSPESLERVRRETWAALGTDPRRRYEEYGAAAGRFDLDLPHLHLNMVGVRPTAQGRGFARKLLEAVHELSASHRSSAGVSLATELEANLPLYQHFGYQVKGSAIVAPGLTTWAMYRPNP